MMIMQGLIMIPVIIGWIFILVAIWRLMKAHEKIASDLEELAREKI